MERMGFDEYVEPLKVYLAKFREAEKRALVAAQAGKAGGVVHSTDGKDA
jgi:hypothetical protein